MLGLMQSQGLMISSILTHAARHQGTAEVVSRTHENTTHRYTWADVESPVPPAGAGAAEHWASARRPRRHAGLERLPASGGLLRRPGMQAICHTINPRLHPDDIAYIINHAQDKVLFVDSSFAALISAIAPRIADSVKTVVMLTDCREHAGGRAGARHDAGLL